MNTIELPESNRKVYIPSNLAECDSRQYAEISQLLYEYENKKIDYYTFRVQAVYAILDMEVAENSDQALQEQKASNIFQLSELIDSFFNEVDKKKQLIQHYTKNHTPYVKPVNSQLYGPTDYFENIKFGEYIDALNFFYEYHATGTKEFLYLLMATMYRKGKGNDDDDGDLRKPYNQYKVKKLAARLELIQFGKVYGFYLLFASFQKYLVTAKIYWLGKEIDLSILFQEDSGAVESDLPGLGIKSTLYSLAESGVYGSADQLNKQPLWEVLMRMYDVIKRDKDFKANQKAAETNSKN